MGLLKKHTEMAKDQAVLIAAEAQAKRRGDGRAAASLGAQIDSLSGDMRGLERRINDESGQAYFAE
jgi:hypothetical protein